ncbi:hypothetical protein FACS1894176_08260 [Bacteroidia bacterium]|nr:hypothetical protein FACS1894176_08260 [Bacteroidia bacterium]
MLTFLIKVHAMAKSFCEDAPEYHTSLTDYKEEEWMTNLPLYVINTITNVL